MNKMKLIFDLEGTIGVFSSGLKGYHNNDIIALRPEAKECLEEAGDSAVVATRAPKNFVNQIIANLESLAGIRFHKILVKEDISLESELYEMQCFKDYADLIENPENTAIIGDFLRFPAGIGNHNDFCSKYLNFSFSKNPEVLTTNFALNDHPVPKNGLCPVYFVVPQMWMQQKTLSMKYVVRQIEKIADAGNGDLKKGFEKLKHQDDLNEYIVYDGLSKQVHQKILGGNTNIYNSRGEEISNEFRQPFEQHYVIMKGGPNDWKAIEFINLKGVQNA